MLSGSVFQRCLEVSELPLEGLIKLEIARKIYHLRATDVFIGGENPCWWMCDLHSTGGEEEDNWGRFGATGLTLERLLLNILRCLMISKNWPVLLHDAVDEQEKMF